MDSRISLFYQVCKNIPSISKTNSSRLSKNNKKLDEKLKINNIITRKLWLKKWRVGSCAFTRLKVL